MEYDCVIECDFKTELVCWLRSKIPSLGVNFNAEIVYNKKKNSTQKLQFNQDLDAMRVKLKIQDPKVTSFYKKGTIYTTTGLPASSTPREFTKQGGEMPKMQAQVAVATGGKKTMGNASGRGRVQLRTVPGAADEQAPPSGGRGAPGGGRGGPPQGGGRGGPPQGGRGGPPQGGRGAPGPAQGGRGGPPQGGRGGPPPQGGRGGPPQGGGRGLPQPGGGRGGPAGRGGGPGPAPPSQPAAGVGKCKALYDYGAQETDELTLREGDVITITQKSGEWWEGVLNGKTGVFPANYVEEI